MFRVKLKFDERTNVGLESGFLREKAVHNGLTTDSADRLIADFTSVVTPLIESARLMKSQGSSFNVTRAINGSGYEVQLEFTTGNGQSLFARLKGLNIGR